MMGAQETSPMKRQRLPFLASLCFVALATCLARPAVAQSADDSAKTSALDAVNDTVNSNEFGTMISGTKDATDQALNKAIAARQGAAWRGNKMGAASSSTAGHLQIRDSLKNASNQLNKGGVLIDHAGYASTAAGEIVEGNYAQGFITIADGLGKVVVSGIGAAAGASFGSLGGPVGTVAGGAAGNYVGSNIWDRTVGKWTGAMKVGLSNQEAKRQFREMAGPKMLGQTADKIHEAYAKYNKELDAKRRQSLAKPPTPITTKGPVGKTKLVGSSQTAIYDPSNGAGDTIRVTVGSVVGFKSESVPGWRNNGTSFSATASQSDSLTIQGTIVTKPWSYFDFNNSVTIKADGDVVFNQAPKIPKEGGSASFSFSFDPRKYPKARSLSIQVSSTGGNPETSTHWVGGTIQIVE